MVRHIWERLPGLWVGLPVLGACLVAVAVGNSIGPLAGVGAGIAIGLLAALVIEAPLRALATVAAKIAAGDRYAIVPKQPPGRSPSSPRRLSPYAWRWSRPTR